MFCLLNILIEKEEKMKIDLKANEVVIKAGNTLHTSGVKVSRGKLIITNQRIYFKSTGDATDADDFEILPKEISEVLFYNKLMIIPQGLDLKTTDGRMLRFTLKGRNDWCRLITSMN
ncbi:hypothetical protein DSECCO2_513340 [anaerobic digester metagenome]|jgi:hypothetical protein